MRDRKLVEVKVFEPAKLNGRYSHPDRHRLTNCWQKPLPNGSVRCWQVGRQGRWDFIDGVCLNFGGRYRAEIVGDISGDREKEADRFVLADAAQVNCTTETSQ